MSSFDTVPKPWWEVVDAQAEKERIATSILATATLRQSIAKTKDLDYDLLLYFFNVAPTHTAMLIGLRLEHEEWPRQPVVAWLYANRMFEYVSTWFLTETKLWLAGQF